MFRIKRKLKQTCSCFFKYTSGALFRTLHNLRMGTISCRVALHQAGKASQGQTLQPIGSIRKLQRKCIVVNTKPWCLVRVNFLVGIYKSSTNCLTFILTVRLSYNEMDDIVLVCFSALKNPSSDFYHKMIIRSNVKALPSFYIRVPCRVE